MEATSDGSTPDTEFECGDDLYLNIILVNGGNTVAGATFTVNYPADYITAPTTGTDGLPTETDSISSAFPFVFSTNNDKTYRCNSSTAGKLFLSGATINETNGGAADNISDVLFTIKFKVAEGITIPQTLEFSITQTELYNPEAGHGTSGDPQQTPNAVPVLFGAVDNTHADFDNLEAAFPVLLGNAANPFTTVTYNACSVNPCDPIARIQSPASGTTFDSTTVTFTWNDPGAEKYWLSIGTTEGGDDLHHKDQGTNTSTVVRGLPGNGEAVYVRLWSRVDGEWQYAEDCAYTAHTAVTTANIQTPASGSVLTSTSVEFTWNDSGAESYWLHIGTTAGGNDLHNKGYGATSATVNGLPDTGGALYVRLWSKINGEWLYDSDCTYTAFDLDGSLARLQTPASGTTLDSTSVTFAWNDSGAERYWLHVGTTAGGSDLHSKGYVGATSATVNGLPNTGVALYVRLWSRVNDEWLYAEDCTYTAFNSVSVADIQTPASGSTFTSTSVQFTWNDTGAERYWLHVGTTAGGNDLHSKGYEGTTSATVNGLPDTGVTLYVRLWSRIDGEWVYNQDCTYTAYTSATVASILTPASGSTFTSTGVTFTWNNVGAEKYWLHVGTTAGGSDLHSKGYEGTTSATVNGLPNNGETLYVRLWSRVDGEWLYTEDCVYTAVSQ